MDDQGRIQVPIKKQQIFKKALKSLKMMKPAPLTKNTENEYWKK